MAGVAAPGGAARPRMEWFQTPAQVTWTFYLKNKTRDDVRVEATVRSMDVVICADAAQSQEFQYAVESLYAEVVPETVAVAVLPMKVEVTVQKAAAYHWPALEALPQSAALAPVSSAPAPAPDAVARPYPNSRGRDWSAFDVPVDELDEKPEGEQALNALFKKIYGDGTDEQRRAMIKSFTESNGTVLSTNWGDVGKEKVKTQPPAGMEVRNFSE